MATSAAQTYFPGFKYKGMVLLDGGNIGDNAPDILLYSELGKATKEVAYMLSIGAGNADWPISPTGMLDPGVVNAGVLTIKIMFAAGETNSTYLAQRNLGDRFMRLEPFLGPGFSLDSAEKASQAKMIDIWQKYLLGEGKPVLDRFLAIVNAS